MLTVVFRIHKVSNIKLANFTTIIQSVPGLVILSLSVSFLFLLRLIMMEGIVFQVVQVPLVVQKIIFMAWKNK